MNAWALVVFGTLACSACARPVLPDPRAAVLRFREAALAGDADAIYSLLDERSQRSYGRHGVARLVRDGRTELSRTAKALSERGVAIETTAELAFRDGEVAVLVAQDGQFRVQAAGALPAGARSPAEALAELRRALGRRSYPALVRVLTQESRGALEQDLRSLVQGLESPGALDIQVDGDSAEVEVVGGHWVKLKREAGVWRVKDFD